MLVPSWLIFLDLFLGGADTWESPSFRFRGERLNVDAEPLKYNVGTLHISEQSPAVKWFEQNLVAIVILKSPHLCKAFSYFFMSVSVFGECQRKIPP